MSHLDVHPEALLDRETRGELSADEHAHLEAHLAQCLACRVERAARRDFEAELFATTSGSRVSALVSHALLSAGTSAPEPSVAGSARIGASRRSLGRRAALLLAATLLFVSGLAFAQTEIAMQVIAATRAVVGLPTRAPEQAPAARKEAKGVSRRPAPSAPEAAVAALPLQDEVPVASAALGDASVQPELPKPGPARPSRARAGRAVRDASRRADGQVTMPTATTRGSSGPVPREVPARADASANGAPSAAPLISPQGSTPDTASVAVPAREPPPFALTSREDFDRDAASELFERATAARRKGRDDDALTLYRALTLRYADSPQGQAAWVISARLLLSRGDAREALAGFDAYLAAHALALREQALVGRIRALELLGRDIERAETLERLRREFPDSPLLSRARGAIAP